MLYEDFSGHNVDVVVALLETCGRFLRRTPHTAPRTLVALDSLKKLRKAKNLDAMKASAVDNAIYQCDPPAVQRAAPKVYSPLHSFIRHMFFVRLKSERDVEPVLKVLLRLPWYGPKRGAEGGGEAAGGATEDSAGGATDLPVLDAEAETSADSGAATPDAENPDSTSGPPPTTPPAPDDIEAIVLKCALKAVRVRYDAMSAICDVLAGLARRCGDAEIRFI